MPIVKPFIAGRRFVSTAGTGTVAGADLTFDNTNFTDDTGAVTTFPASYAFLTLYINGVIQTSDTITGVTTTTATIVGGAVLDPGTPIAIEFTIT
ncbi:DUF4183 domain-containing protein [Bacillus cereus]|uniref:DUF4183 domain-containing protein n=1 Tax=Bacillus TaxID=1386 RepID=UPI000BF7D15C|nr:MULTISPECIES: DUF4183 domain-containing protein [Bacillus cereus group]MCI4247569.1 DUF4183 domain-containing protein [Bacillus sp. CCB-MMP212]MCU5146588.1 DUF4183 domain-containing protein [Bacillus cereus]MCU5493339.1 DUF4183 domain-containing protein [Bacillus cereus]MCU5635563.1 DUF4183 domain-containing protein [Bacillus cereus]MCU5700277.1 DUF4183 domain-containing protein [Bacillus cereus]